MSNNGNVVVLSTTNGWRKDRSPQYMHGYYDYHKRRLANYHKKKEEEKKAHGAPKGL